MAPSVGRVVAILGPTNTGKTHLAIERMLAHASGMIGFPLRLLARENYDRVVRLKGENAVALVTGEEKIIPPYARWWICTVESMPLEREVACLAVDEIQLCADPERGHIFTDRLLHARGVDETLFLGSDTIKPLLSRLVPRAEFVSRSRLSTLAYAGHKKVTRLPPRSAIVAFSANEVYETAELIRRQRGGTAVVLGALSPRTRNAQVAMYQSGEVDYLVATDAIGMGLNMDVDHVAFARLNKFDGNQSRRLTPAEIGQIAGRAGRHMSNGTFGTTGDASELDPVTIEKVETHRFDVLKHLYWRNSELDFRSSAALLKSLDARPPTPALARARPADDQLALAALARDEAIEQVATTRDRVRLLWDVCQVPDFRKVMSDAHARLLAQLFKHLVGPTHRLPVDWIANQVARLDRTDGDIDTLVQRIAHIRTWTYVAHRADWTPDPAHWQELTRSIEDRLSDALHERLTQRFVDRRSSALAKRLSDGGDLLAGVTQEGAVVVEGHPVGRLEGLRFTPDPVAQAEDGRAVLSAARRALRDEMQRRVSALERDEEQAFALDEDGAVRWREHPVATLVAGATPLAPRVRALSSELLGTAEAQRVVARVERWIEREVARRLGPLVRLDEAQLDGPARGVAWELVRALGIVPRAAVEPQLRAMDKTARTALRALGVAIGAEHVYLTGAGKPAAATLKRALWRAHAGYRGALPLPPAGPVSIEADRDVPAPFYEAIGWPLAGARAVRVDALDRLAQSLIRAAQQAGGIAADPAWARRLGCTPAEAESVVIALGWRKVVDETGARFRRARRPRSVERGARRGGTLSADGPFASLETLRRGR
jgi:ATP-dependent RNA helicase SUPV3L1/SUV3